MMTELTDREQRFQALQTAMVNTSEKDMQSWREETDAWEKTELTDITEFWFGSRASRQLYRAARYSAAQARRRE